MVWTGLTIMTVPNPFWRLPPNDLSSIPSNIPTCGFSIKRLKVFCHFSTILDSFCFTPVIASYWTVEEVDLGKDQFDTLKVTEIKSIMPLVFFLGFIFSVTAGGSQVHLICVGVFCGERWNCHWKPCVEIFSRGSNSRGQMFLRISNCHWGVSILLFTLAFCLWHFALLQNVHAEMYSLLIDTYVTDRTEKSRLFNAVNNCNILFVLTSLMLT